MQTVPEETEALLDAMAGAAAFRSLWVHRQHEQLDRLTEQLPLPQITLPLQFSTDLGPSHLEALTSAFTAGLRAIPEPGDR